MGAPTPWADGGGARRRRRRRRQPGCRGLGATYGANSACAAGSRPLGQWSQGVYVAASGFEYEGHSRMAKGSAAVADLVAERESMPYVLLRAFEEKMCRELGVWHSQLPWSLEQHADRINENISGHKTLKKLLALLAPSVRIAAAAPRSAKGGTSIHSDCPQVRRRRRQCAGLMGTGV